MHRIDVFRAAVLKGDGVVFVGPNGGHGGMATLCDHAAHRPLVD